MPQLGLKIDKSDSTHRQLSYTHPNTFKPKYVSQTSTAQRTLPLNNARGCLEKRAWGWVEESGLYEKV